MSDLDKGGKGFAGLAGISPAKDVASQPAPSPDDTPPQSSGTTSSVARTDAESDIRVNLRSPRSAEPVSQTKNSAGAKIVVVLGLLALAGYGLSRIGGSDRTNLASSQFATASAGSEATPPESEPDEDRPPVGTNLVLNARQMRYCVFEQHRLDGAESAVDQYEDGSVRLFNSLIADFNSRCGSFRYRAGSLAPIEREGAAAQANLMNQGRLRMLEAQAATDAAPDSAYAAAAAAAQAAADAAASSYDHMPVEPKADSPGQGFGTAEAVEEASAGAAAAAAAAAAANAAADAAEAAADAAEAAVAESQGSSANADPANLRTCLSGNYPSLCKRSLLSPRERIQVDEAERQANLRTCLSGNYPSLCKDSLLSATERAQVREAERQANLRTCLSGNYPSLCKRSLLSASEQDQVFGAERRENLRTCMSGNYPSLCKKSLLSASEKEQVAEAERRENLRTCMSGRYPSLCKRSLLTAAEIGQVAEAERREGSR